MELRTYYYKNLLSLKIRPFYKIFMLQNLEPYGIHRPDGKLAPSEHKTELISYVATLLWSRVENDYLQEKFCGSKEARRLTLPIKKAIDDRVACLKAQISPTILSHYVVDYMY